MGSGWRLQFTGGANACSDDSVRPLQDELIRGVTLQTAGDFRTASRRLLVVSTHLDATTEISFLAPIRGRDAPDVAVAVVDQARIDELRRYHPRNPTGTERLLMDLLRPTHVVFSRCWSYGLLALLSEAKTRRIPVICFLDDDLLDVPAETGADIFTYFMDSGRREILRHGIVAADLMVTSTPPLKEKIQRYRPDKPIYACNLYKSVSPASLPAAPSGDESDERLGYMGSASHQADLKEILPALVRVLNARPALRLEFFGTIRPPPDLGSFGDRIVHHTKAASYDDFLTTLARLKWTVGLAPLRLSRFNATKADTKWVEYSLAGIPAIVSDSPVYARPIAAGACLPASLPDWASAIEGLLDDPTRRRSLLAASCELLRTSYTHEKHVEQMIDYLDLASSIAARNHRS